MLSDSIPNVSIPMPPKDFAKKKRVNRLAKLKQCKLDARREQWLSQVKNKGLKEELNSGGGNQGPSIHVENERTHLIEKLEIKPRDVEENLGSINHYSDSDSPSNSPTSHSSSVMEGQDSGTTFTGSSSSGGCCSGSISEEDNDCLDDWEAIADALAATDPKPEQHNSSFDSTPERDENVVQGTGVDIMKQQPEDRGLAPRPRDSCQAWRPDDAFRPQSLPHLSKQHTFPVNSKRHCHGGTVWGCKSLSVPTSCPICCEDLDFTDTSFLPCSCGYMLCLFCHKRILEEDGRCPNCRKQYNQDPKQGEATADGAFRLGRSCSMISRS